MTDLCNKWQDFVLDQRGPFCLNGNITCMNMWSLLLAHSYRKSKCIFICIQKNVNKMLSITLLSIAVRIGTASSLFFYIRLFLFLFWYIINVASLRRNASSDDSKLINTNRKIYYLVNISNKVVRFILTSDYILFTHSLW